MKTIIAADCKSPLSVHSVCLSGLYAFIAVWVQRLTFSRRFEKYTCVNKMRNTVDVKHDLAYYSFKFEMWYF